MHYISLAENAHDSCITIADELQIILHLELERFFNKKRYRIEKLSTLESLISLLLNEYSINDDIQFVVSRHHSERLYSIVSEFVHNYFPKKEIYDVEHLDAHAAFSHLSGLKDSLVIAFDGGGDRRINSNQPNFLAYHYHDNSISPINDIHKPRFDGRVWNVIATKLFGDFHASGKVMGLSAYGIFSPKYEEILLGEEFLHLDTIWQEKNLSKLLNLLRIDDFEDSANLAYTLQKIFTDDLVATINRYRHYSDNIVLVGGCALNIISNTEIGERLNYNNVYVPPCPGDEGQSLGSLLQFFHSHRMHVTCDEIPYLGQGLRKVGKQISSDDYNKMASLILDNKSLAWHIGRSEIGPRALGHRSILASPARLETKVAVSEKIKQREFFRPIAPIVLEEHASDWFDFQFSSPYMSFSAKAKQKAKEYAPAIVHADGTSRIQTLSYSSNPEIYELISRVYDMSGIPILMNTSLNVAGLPICNSEQDSKIFFVSTSIDALNLNGHLYIK
ncbi:MAG: hypothetical protein GVY04_14405 [Cyanobacteria bacterium]|jgi:carbamoyltransferase|nr:hypothetical protein [Cyanobacteria bacterium GSL.Bin1]